MTDITIIVWLSLWVAKIVTHFLPAVFQILAGVVSSGTRKYALVLRALQIPISLVLWTVTCLATFVPLMTRNPDNRARGDTRVKSWESIVQSILGAAVAATLVLLIQKLIIQLISINYHRKQFNARIKESKRTISLLGQLYDASRNLFPMYGPEFAEEDYIIADQLSLHKALGSSKFRSHNRSGSNTPMRLLQDVGRIGDKVTSAFGNVAQEITGKEVFNPNSAHSIVVTALEKRASSEALARRLWMSFVMEGKEALYIDDLLDVLGHDRQTEAEEAFVILDADANGDVSLDEAVLTVGEIGRERKAIATSMHDVDQAITVLDRLLMVVVLVATVFIFVAFLNRNFVTTLATAGTTLLSLSFVFAVTCQEVLGSCIFLFVKHPFDIGDRIDINNQQLVVDHISLLFSVFRRVSGDGAGRMVQVPNIVLNTQWIENVSRSKAMKEQFQVEIAYDTTFDDVQLLKAELQTFVKDKDNSRDFQPDLEVEVLGTPDLSKLLLRVEIRHKSNWANETIRAARRSKFMCAFVAALRLVPIHGPGGGGEALGSAANATYTVAIPAEVAKANADETTKKKNDARLVPIVEEASEETDKVEEGGLRQRKLSNSSIVKNATVAAVSHSTAIEDLTSKDVAADEMRDTALALESSRTSIDRRDEANIRSIIRRESTKGRRKASGTYPRSLAQSGQPYNGTTGTDYAPRPSGDSFTRGGDGILPVSRVPTDHFNPLRQIRTSPGSAQGQYPQHFNGPLPPPAGNQIQGHRSVSSPFRRDVNLPPRGGHQIGANDTTQIPPPIQKKGPYTDV